MYYLNNPIGVDQPIQALQSLFDSELWLGQKRKIYGRAFRNMRNDAIIPEVYVGENQYKEVKFDDRYTVQIFFDQMGDIDYEDATATTQIGVVVSVNLTAIYPDRGRSATEEAIRDVVDLIENSPARPTGILMNQQAYEPFEIAHAKINMHPWFTFRVVCELSYIYQNC